MLPRYIAIEGNIGSGKTTLATLLAGHYGGGLLLEAFADNEFLPGFYADPARNALPLELSFLADRYMQLQNLPTMPGPVVADYIFDKTRIFAGINLPAAEYRVFDKLYGLMAAQVPVPDLLVYLDAPVSLLQQHIQKRSRTYEQAIATAYLEQLDAAYKAFLAAPPCPAIIIDAQAVNFLQEPGRLAELVGMMDKGSSGWCA